MRSILDVAAVLDPPLMFYVFKWTDSSINMSIKGLVKFEYLLWALFYLFVLFIRGYLLPWLLKGKGNFL